MKPRLILVGGFLGAGKTTLLKESARHLAGEGRTVGLITNDQTDDLVDTALLMRSSANVREVSGSCFCCNFNGFMDAVQSLADRGADIIIAEPVGSCTDLSATILQPVKEKYRHIDLAPLTVLVDPDRVREVLRNSTTLMHEDALYILRLQMLEADRILLNKIDMLGENERDAILGLLRGAFPGIRVEAISARTGEGLADWLAAVLKRDEKAGIRIVDVDYDRYAEGEAALGWLNAVINLKSSAGKAEWSEYGHRLLDQLHESFKSNKAEIGHVKLMMESECLECTIHLTHLGGTIAVRGDEGVLGAQARCILNARVQMPPSELERIVRDAIATSAVNGILPAICSLQCFKPGRPNPTYRYSRIS